jgi:disulfide bond formation protein DsbB
MTNFLKSLRPHLAYLAWVQALVATLGSLFFSEVMKFTPCVLCWYQRIAMYPLVFILAVGIFTEDEKVKKYVLPLSLTGLGIAIYHNLLYYHLISPELLPCSLDNPCTARQFFLWGFISIPLLSLVAFTVITACMLLYKKQEKS